MPTQTAISAQAARLSEELGHPIAIAVSARSTRMRMRVDPAQGSIVVSVHPSTTAAHLRDFITSNAGWIRTRAGKLPERVPLVHGAVIPVLGVDHRICHDGSARFPSRFRDGADGPEILIGKAESVERRVVDFLREEAYRHFSALTREKASAIGRTVRSISIKDTTSRWGSCSARGEISYSWRIMLATPEIADYLVAHEVSHLAEMNHGPRFWKLCRSLSAIPPERARQWLEVRGNGLFRFGPA